jgi:hypothetical protein
VKVHLPKENTYLPFNLVRTCKGTITRLNLGFCACWSAYFRSLSYFCRHHCLFRKDLGCIWVISGLFGFSSEHHSIRHRDRTVWSGWGIRSGHARY